MHKNFLASALGEFSECHGGEGILKHLEVFPGAAFQAPVSFMNYTVLPPHTSIGLHEHGNDQEMYIILGGHGEMEINGKVTPAAAGDVYVNPPFGTHGLRNTGEEDMPVLVLEVRVGEV